MEEKKEKEMAFYRCQTDPSASLFFSLSSLSWCYLKIVCLLIKKSTRKKRRRKQKARVDPKVNPTTESN